MVSAETGVLQYILNVTQLPNKPLVTTAGLTAILEIVTSTTDCRNILYLLEHGLADILSKCFDNSKVVKGQPYNSILVMVALKLTWHLSRLSHLVVRPLMTEAFFTKLLKFIEIGGDFFELTDDFSKELSSLVLRKQLIADVRIETMSGGLSKYLLDNEILPHSVEPPKNIYKCKCFDTSGEKDVDITEHLVSQNMAWPSPDKDISESENWKDLIVTRVVDKHYFYALVGEGSIRQVKLIKAIMDESSCDLQPAKIEVGKIVVASIRCESQRGFHRGQVLSHQGEWLKIVLLDSGGIQDVRINQVYELPFAISLMYFPAQATLCCLAGISATPSDPLVSQLAIASVCNLIKHSVASGLVLMKTNCIDILSTVLQCPDPVLVLQSVRVLNNLASNPRAEKDVFEPVMLDLLALMKDLGEKSWSIKLKEDITFAMMSCLANILYMGKNFRTSFYQNEGLSIVLSTLVNHHPTRPVSKMARQLLRNFLVEIQAKVPAKTSSLDTVADNKLNKKDRAEKKDSSRSPGLATNSTGSLTEQSTVPTLRMEDFSSSEDEGEKHGAARIHRRTRHDSGDSFISEDYTPSGTGNVVTVYSDNLTEEPTDFYLYDSQVDFSDDVTHELRPHQCLKYVTVNAIAEITCGMLNSRGGTIYFGITKDGQVKGVKISRDGRDSFRLGVDQMLMNRLVPSVLYIQSELVYKPVFQKTYGTQPGKYAQVTDLYVIEIRIRPSRSAMHSVTQGKQCYYRFGPNNLPLTAKEVRELVVGTEENNYKEEIIAQRLKVQSLQKELLSL